MRTKVLLTGILLLALALRIWGLGWGLPDANRSSSYHPDELSTLVKLGSMNPRTLDFKPKSYAEKNSFINPTFHTYVVGAVLAIGHGLGILQLVPSKEYYVKHPDAWRQLFWVGRFVSVVSGMVLVGALYLLGRDFWGTGAGLLAALWGAILPAFVIHSKFLTVNLPAVVWMAVALLAIHRVYHKGETQWYIGAGILSGLAFSTKYNTLPLILMLVSAHVLRRDGATWQRKLLDIRIYGALLAFVLAFLLGTPYALLAFDEFSEGFLFNFGRVTSYHSINFVDRLEHTILLLWDGMGTGILVLALVGFVTLALRPQDRRWDALLIGMILLYGILLISAGPDVAMVSRGLPIFLLILLVAVGGMSALRHLLSPKRRIWITGGIALGTLYTIVFVASLNLLYSGEDVRDQVGRWVQSHVPPGTTIILGSYLIPSIYHDYFHADPEQRKYHYTAYEPAGMPLEKLKQAELAILEERAPDWMLRAGFLPVYHAIRPMRRFGILWQRRPVPDMLYHPEIYVYAQQEPGR